MKLIIEFDRHTTIDEAHNLFESIRHPCISEKYVEAKSMLREREVRVTPPSKIIGNKNQNLYKWL